MRIPSGVVDQYCYFIAVDATDLKTRETGLATFTVYRSRNGGASAAMTTPTINETDSANMPGVYELLMDEDMTLDAGDQSQEMVFHITHAGMAPVDRVIEIYRPSVTAGETITVSSGAVSTVTNTTQLNGATTVVLTDASSDAVLADAIWNAATATYGGAGSYGLLVETDLDATITSRMASYAQPSGFLAATFPTGTIANTTNITAGTMTNTTQLNGAATVVLTDSSLTTAKLGAFELAKTTNITGFNDIAAASIVSGGAITTLAGAVVNVDTVDAVTGLTASNLDTTVSSRLASASYTAPDNANIALIVADTNELQTDWVNGGRLDLILDARASQTSVDTVDTVADAIKLQTDKFVFTVANQVDSNIQSVNDITVTGNGQTGTEWGP